MYPPDYLATRSNRELVELLRDSRTLPIEHLLNRGSVRIDYAKGRIDRDSFWKGSFARDTLLGLDARLFTRARTAEPFFNGGTFWKRFDRVEGESVTGYVVNYGIASVPGLPRVRAIRIPDDSSPYVRAGDEVLLLEYQNHPYRMVYDLLKIVDPNNCIGIFHLGRFPRGVRAGTFLLARNSYPFDKMSVPDHNAIFDAPDTATPTLVDLRGAWRGTRVFIRRPDIALGNQFNPSLGSVTMESGTDRQTPRVTARARLTRLGFDQSQLRMAGPATLLARKPTTSGDVRRYVFQRLSLG